MWWLSMLLCCSWFGCSDDPPVDDDFHASEDYNRSIQVEVKHLYDMSTAADSLLTDVTILLFEDRDNFAFGGYPDAFRITDTTGKASFEFLSGSYYWIRATHPLLGELEDSVSTPANTLSFVFLTYF